MIYGLPMPGIGEMIVLLILGVLLFGRKLPEIGRSVGKTIVELKKGMAGIEDHVDNAVKPQQTIEQQPVRPPARLTPSAPVFKDDSVPPNSMPSDPPKI